MAVQQSLTQRMTVAKRLILKEWKSPPSFQQWLADMISVVHMERLRYLRTNSLRKFSSIWDPFLAYLDVAWINPDSIITPQAQLSLLLHVESNRRVFSMRLL